MVIRENEAKQQILSRIRVSRQLVTLAKSFQMRIDEPRDFLPDDFAAIFARQQGYEAIRPVVLHPSANVERQLDQVAGRLSCELALGQALRELIGSGQYMPAAGWREVTPSQEWTTVVQGGSGHSGSWRFEELKHCLPERVLWSPLVELLVNEAFTDPDLFAVDAGLEGAHAEVLDAARDAVLCLRHGIYRAAVAQLGKAMEGAWIELGLALAGTLPANNPMRAKVEGYMRDDGRFIAKKISDVRDLYGRRDLMGSVHKAAEIRPEELGSAVIWSDVVREARNAIHFGAKPTTANTYEKVVVLFLEGAKSLASLYRIKKAADALAVS